MPRMLTMFLMLAIMALIFVRLRDPSTWRFFAAGDDGQQVAPDTASKSSAHGTAENSVAHSSGVVASPKDSAAVKSLPTTSGGGDKVPPDAVGGLSNDQKPVGEPSGGTTSVTPTSTPPELTPTGPTDEDQEEMEEIKPSMSVLSDGSFETKPEEQPAYFRILGWVDHQPTELLRKRAVRDCLYDTLINSPDTMRLQIVEFKLNVKQIVSILDKPKDGKLQPVLSPEGKPLYEVRGVTSEGGSNIYFAVVTDLPPGMPIGTLINEDARLVGYFFKVQGYVSQQQQLDAERLRRKMKPLKAPLIIGRLIWITQPATMATTKTPVWVLAPIGGIAIIVLAGWIYWSSRRPRRNPLLQISTTGRNLDPDAPSVDGWLEQAQSGRFQMDPALETAPHSDGAALDLGFVSRFSGNIFEDIGESNNGHSSHNGHSDNGNSGSEPEIRENDTPGS